MTRRPSLIFVYNADSGLFDTLTDAAHKILSPRTYACNLCKVTYGWFTERKAWRAFVESLDADCTFLHRDQFREHFPDLDLALPAVLRLGADGSPAVCVDATTLNECKDVDALAALIRNACAG